ncbi:hypothetical protein [Pararhizobium haloflavum]|uniref:hypothetical protein n=1 Tax=Pararhizobium haloflavum TaxID=2037914 RepID=UPI000C19C5F6|nr:hypothetical protein [Pararhizobium haloflavum]
MAKNPLVVIETRDEVLERYGNMLGALGEREAHKALARAVNRVTNTVHSRVVRAVAKQTSLTAGRVRKEIKKRQVRPGGMGALEGVIWATGRPLPLKEFRPKQFSWGVRAKVWGQTQRFPGAFIYAGTYRSGIYVGNGHVFTNTRGPNTRSGRNNAVEMMFGPSIPEEMVRGESRRTFEQTVATMLPQRVFHEISRALKF